LKKGYPILIIFGTHIRGTTDHQNGCSVSHLTQRLLLHYLVKTERNRQNMH